MKLNLKVILRRRKNKNKEKGAALVTVVLLLMLLLVVAGAVVLVTALSNTATVDAAAEEQAYYAAEAGMQMTLNVLRGNGNGNAVSFKKAAVRVTSNKGDDWYPDPRLSNWLNYTYPASLPDRVPLTASYNPNTGLAFSVTISPPDIATVIPEVTPNPDFIDGPVVMPSPKVKPSPPAWHPWHCGHCSWDYTHCSLYPNGFRRNDGYGCRHKHCIPPPGWGQAGDDDGYQRLLVKVVGYGPRGARKQIELLVKRLLFNYDSEALIYIHGTTSGGDLSFSTSGNPQVTFDSGDNNIGFGVRTDADSAIIQNVINQKDKVQISGKGDDYETFNGEDQPEWLETVDTARQLVSDLKLDATLRNRYFTSYPSSGNTGTDSQPEFTFVDGDCNITSDGSGLLVVTGKLTLSSSKKYKGLILLLGKGEFIISGGGATFEGAMAIAKFNSTGDFLPPVITLSGGSYTFKYKSDRIAAAIKTINLAVVGAREY